MEDGHVGLHRIRCEARCQQLLLDTLLTDLVVLVQDDEHVVVVLLRKACLLGHALEDAAVIDHDGVALDTHAVQEQGGDVDQLGLGRVGGIAQDVDVALGELAETTLLGTVGAPDRAHLQRLEGGGELADVVGVVAGQGHGQIVAHTRVAEIVKGGGLDGLGELLAALEHLEDQLLVLATLLAGEVLDALHAGGLDLGVTKRGVEIFQLAEEVLADLHLSGENVAHTLDGFFDKHGFVCPSFGFEINTLLYHSFFFL